MSLSGNSKNKRGRDLMSNNLNNDEDEIRYGRNERAFEEM